MQTLMSSVRSIPWSPPVISLILTLPTLTYYPLNKKVIASRIIARLM